MYHDLTTPLKKKNKFNIQPDIINCSGYIDHKSLKMVALKYFNST